MLRDSEERFSPHQKGDIALDHYARYTMAAMMVNSNHEVLDCASGEGYGSALLASKARRVTGVDLSAEAVMHASLTYVRPNLRFLQGNAEDLAADGVFYDVITSFETIEHLRSPMMMLQGFKRLLKPEGFVIISTPDEEVFNEGRAVKNPHHPSEFSRSDFEEALSDHWNYVRLLGQTTSRTSLVTSADGNPTTMFAISRRAEDNGVRINAVIERPMYLIAVCSDAALPPVPSLVFV